MHTVFSDGSVWPDIRVEEAIRDGIDVIALTEHLEYLGHKDDIPFPDRNRSTIIAKDAAKDKDLIVLNGSEVTRDMPPGHVNAIFVDDSNRLLQDDPTDVFLEAKRQGAFIFWNHPNWLAQARNGIVPLTEMHRDLIRKNLLHGIEVVNDITYSDEALQIALDYDLTIIGTSDIHGLVDWQYHVPEGGHRPVTLVFAKDKSSEAVRRALFQQKTVVWFRNFLIGREQYLMPLLKASLTIEEAFYSKGRDVAEVIIKNHSDARFELKNTGKFNFHEGIDLVTIQPHSTITLIVKTVERRRSFKLAFEVMNAITAPRTHPTLILSVQPDS
ncbi:MAG: PHP domain-containing protein [Candidatus Marinimicrobia bacterium]|nr:PHP domain-containing protein [Candidatus Neomarinimicrobiota bacterium]|tara:strand:+ start:6583 stop:7566 length:984 start_codon:yes stop_codon:yes gene_type:complete